MVARGRDRNETVAPQQLRQLPLPAFVPPAGRGLGTTWVRQLVKSCSSDALGSSTRSPQRTRSSSTAFASRASTHVGTDPKRRSRRRCSNRASPTRIPSSFHCSHQSSRRSSSMLRISNRSVVSGIVGSLTLRRNCQLANREKSRRSDAYFGSASHSLRLRRTRSMSSVVHECSRRNNAATRLVLLSKLSGGYSASAMRRYLPRRLKRP